MNDHFSLRSKFTKLFVGVFVFIQIFYFVTPSIVQAQAAIVEDFTVGANTNQININTAETSFFTEELVNQGWQIHGLAEKSKKVDQGLLSAGIASLIHASSYFMDKIAYDTAKAVAQGGNGLKSLIYEKDWGTYLGDTAKDAVGDFIENFSKDALGIGLCQIPDPHLAIYLTLGFKSIYGKGGPQSSCSWATLRGNWSKEAFEKKYGPGGSRFLSETFSANIKVSESDYGIGLTTVAKLNTISAQRKDEKKAERIEGEGFKAVTNMITGRIESPADLVQRETSVASNEYRVKASNEALWGIAASGATQVFVHAGSVFLNTLTSELINQVLTKCWVNCDSSGETEGEQVNGVLGMYNSPGRSENPLNLYNKLLAARPVTQLNNFDIVTHFASCPDSPGINNCVIDTDFQRILAGGRNGNTMTIREAIDKGLLHSEWPLISPKREGDNTNKECYQGKYCYSNIQKLRKVRILPLGFEVAALRSDPDQPWTLGRVVDNFENCLRVNDQGRPDPNGKTVKEDLAHPFCHLINPNWIIRVPAMQCDAQVVTESLESEGSSQRRQECVDVKTCINEGENGSCGGTYGYCTQEKNIWRIPGDTCPAEFSTCTTYSQTGVSGSHSYLARTVDYGECSIDNVGCRAYALEKNNNIWQGTSNVGYGLNLNAAAKNIVVQGAKDLGRGQMVYFDESIKSESSLCKPGSNGCTAFFPAQRDQNGQYIKTSEGIYAQNKTALVHLKKAPEYLGCYDGVADILGTQWPKTANELAVATQANPACDAFASVCSESEVGCEAYNPLKGGPMIPGIIGAQNVCASECVGYETFKQEAGELAKFSKEKFPLFFIPAQGKSCEAKYAGCDEFTNIDSRSQGGEKREYYTDLKYCEKPLTDGSNQKVFYTWEGSIREGLSLRTHKLLPVSTNEHEYLVSLRNVGARIINQFPVGSPAYSDDSEIGLRQNDQKCNEQSYNLRINSPFDPGAADPDCKAFYDDSGKIFFRLLSETVTVSATCHPLRKTTAEFFTDENLQGKPDVCAAKGGSYNAQNGECQRCMNGGRFENNFCIYQTISQPGESVSCPAAQNGCRAYTGSGTNNLREVFNDDFEAAGGAAAADQLLADWAPRRSLSISAEATHVGSHSLSITGGNVTRQMATGTFANEGWYELTFWAKGSNKNLSISLSQLNDAGQKQVKASFTVDPVTNQAALAGVDQEWRSYRFGPVQFVGSTSTPILIDFAIQGDQANALYLDHVRLSQVRDHLYLINNSWKTSEGYDVPMSCDSAPQDGLPGEALGCAAYKDSKQQVRNATGFEKLCREKAVSCEPFWNTENTINGADAEKKQVFNLVCNAQTGTIVDSKCTLHSVGANPQNFGECQIKPFSDFCYISKVSIEAEQSALVLFGEKAMVTSTVIVLGDTPSSTPIFLANRKEFQCSEAERGCMMLGLENQMLPDNTVSSSYTFSDTMVKNDPEKYNETLCRDDIVGCGEFKSGTSISYFKDPKVLGSSMCTYSAQKSPGEPFGWFFEGVGKCSGTDTLCRADKDCGGNTPKCEQIGSVACYPDYQRQGGLYDLWSNNTSQYKGYVGSCPNKYNLCTELVDPADTSAVHPNGQPYYVIFNKQITANVGECNGKVSLTEGCVMFDKTDAPNKTYNTAATYLDSEKSSPKYSLVAPKSIPAQNDANLILKVDRDRMCSRWLQCSTQVRQVDETGKAQTLCYAFRECEELQGGVCVKWTDNFESPKNISDSQNKLSYGKFIQRGTSWYDAEYSGYSLYDKYRIHDMVYVSLNLKELQTKGFFSEQTIKSRKYDDKQYIAFAMDNQFFSPNFVPGQDYSAKGCMNTPARPDSNWFSCGFDSGGRCYNGSCIYPIDGRFPNDATARAADGSPNESGFIKVLAALERNGGTNACKSYPEKTSPFPTSVVAENGLGESLIPLDGNKDVTRHNFIQLQKGYEGVNVCQNGNCSCGYQKISYKGGITDYWTFSNQAVKQYDGICIGGKRYDEESSKLVSYDGALCDENDDCGAEPGEGNAAKNELGTCSFVNARENHFGFKGYCLEYDYSRPLGKGDLPFACLTWLPIQVSASNVDNYNSDPRAGYSLAEDVGMNGGGEVFCAVGTKVGAGPYDPAMFDQEGFEAVGSDVTAYYNLYFNADGSPKAGPGIAYFCHNGNNPVVDAGWCSCEPPGINRHNGGGRCFEMPRESHCKNNDTYGGPYETAICEENINAIYTAIQSWLWKAPFDEQRQMDRKNSVILRIEKGKGNGTFDNKAWGHYTSNGVTQIYSFAANTPEGLDEYGVIMHPPRFWPQNAPRSADGSIISSHFTASDETRGNKAIAVEDPENNLINANVFSPNLKLRDSLGSTVYRSAFEEQLRLSQLKRVSFLPLSYSDDSYGNVPTLIQSADPANHATIDIDFEKLSNAESYAYIVSDAAGLDLYQFPKEKRQDGDIALDTLVWGYVQRDQAIAHFNDYHIFPQATQEVGNDPRNTISRRYVVVISDWNDGIGNNSVPAFIDRSVLNANHVIEENGHHPPNPGDDPFIAACNRDDDSNWLAVGMDFNNDGEFLGYISRWCNIVRDGEDVGMQFATVAQLADQCIQFNQVYQHTDNDLYETTNKAWTQRTWNEAKSVLAGQAVPYRHPMSVASMGNLYRDFKVNTQLNPYGSISLTSSDFADDKKIMGFGFRKPEGNRVTPFGLPYACLNAWLSAPTINRTFGGVVNNCQGVYIPAQNADLTAAKTNINAIGNIDITEKAISQIFAQVFAKKTVFTVPRIPNTSFVPVVVPGAGMDKTADYNNAEDLYTQDKVENRPLLPPQIYSLDPSKCANSQTGKCVVGEKDNITLNLRNGTVTDYNEDGLADEDLDGDGRADAFIQNGSMSANLKFFAYGDDNRMPIRRVMVNWGDGNIMNSDRKGLYKNHKPFCSVEGVSPNYCGSGNNAAAKKQNAVERGLTCAQDIDCPNVGDSCINIADPFGPRFGSNGARACVAAPFEFVHEYICSRSDIPMNGGEPIGDKAKYVKRVSDASAIDPGTKERLLALGLNENSWVCVFKPAVQVLDNWGWCNGSTKVAGIFIPKADGYYSDASAAADACSSEYDTPWTYYKGSVIVVPPPPLIQANRR